MYLTCIEFLNYAKPRVDATEYTFLKSDLHPRGGNGSIVKSGMIRLIDDPGIQPYCVGTEIWMGMSFVDYRGTKWAKQHSAFTQKDPGNCYAGGYPTEEMPWHIHLFGCDDCTFGRAFVTRDGAFKALDNIIKYPNADTILRRQKFVFTN